MDWHTIKRIGYPANKDHQVVKNYPEPDEYVELAQHTDGSGWRRVLQRPNALPDTEDDPVNGQGTYIRERTFVSDFSTRPYTIEREGDFPDNDASWVKIPEGIAIKVYDHTTNSDGDFSPKEYVGPKTKTWGSGQRRNDDISRIKVYRKGEKLVARAGKKYGDDLKNYFAQGKFYVKPHLKPYNKLFDS